MDWDVGALVEDTDKLRNFVEDDFDFFEYEQGRSSTIVVAGRLKSHIQFWRSIGASQFILDVIEHGFRILFHSSLFMFSFHCLFRDAGDLGVGGIVKDHKGVICHLPWTANKMFRSSTWRELKAVDICL